LASYVGASVGGLNEGGGGVAGVISGGLDGDGGLATAIGGGVDDV
jgi:hypothetical protein